MENAHQCCVTDIEACSMCAEHYCHKCSERTFIEDHEKILNKKSQYCVQCSYKKLVSVGYCSHTLETNKKINNKRQRRHSWHYTLQECDFSEFNDDCVSNEVLEEVRLIMLNLFIKKADEFLVLHTDGFEKIHSFKKNISEKFLFGDIKNAYTYLHNFISASINSLNLWLEEIELANKEQKERLKYNLENISIPHKKIKFNLSLKKTNDEDSLDDSDNGKELVNAEVNENRINESIHEIQETSDDSIFSQMTEEIVNFDTSPNPLENNELPRRDVDRESNVSEKSFVFNISEFQYEQNEYDNNLISCQSIADNENEFAHTINENELIDELAYQTHSQECSSNSLLGKENLEIQKINILRSLGLKPQNDELDNDELRIHEIHMNRLLQNIEDEPLLTSEEESFDDDLDDERTSEYIELPEGIYGKITNRLPCLPTAIDSPAIPNNENCDTYENYNLKECWVVVEKLVEPILTDNKQEQTFEDSKRNSRDEIERLLDIDSLEKKRHHSSSNRRPCAKKLKPNSNEFSPNTLDCDSDSDSGDDDVHLNIDPLPNNDTSKAEILENLLDKILDDKDEDTQEEPESVIEEDELKKRKPVIENGNNKQNNKENEPESNDAVVQEKKSKTDSKSDWKADPLLHFSFRDASDVRNKKNGTIPELLRDRISKLEGMMLRSDNATLKSDEKEQAKVEKESEEPIDIPSDVDVAAKCDEIILNSESDSDIEYVTTVKEDLNNSGDSQKSKGRKNIRAILDYTTLTQATKTAHLQERRRKNRLTQKQKNMEAILSQSQFSEEDDGFILDIDETTKTPIVVIHPALSKKLKSHQKAGVKFMWDSCYEGVERITSGYLGSGCILAHCMGLGKTLQVVTLIHTLFTHEITKTKHVLVVCPLSVVPHWQREFDEATKNLEDTSFQVFCISNRQIRPLDRIYIIQKWRRECGVLIMGYESYHSLVLPKKNTNLVVEEHNVSESLCNPGPDLVILDEGHLIKNEHTFRAKALRNLKTKRRIVLTGTPLQNNLIEYYHMIQFVKPNLLGSLHEYQNRFSNPITNGQYHDSTEKDILKMKNRSHVLNKLLKGTVQRFELSELVPYLKKRHDYALFIQMNPLQMELYEQEAYLAGSKIQDSMSTNHVMAAYNKFKCIWSHPYIFHLKELAARKQNKNGTGNDFWWNGFCPADCDTNLNYGPKFKIMLNIIKECEMAGDKILVELDAIEHFLQQTSTVDRQWIPNEDYLRMDGKTSSESRVQLCDSFNDKSNPRKRVFLISNKVGGMGLNLMGANRVILMNVNWNPADDSQSVFRIYRFGQEKECFIYRLVSMGTMEEVIYDRQVTKLATSGRVIDSLQITRHFKSNDLRILFTPKFIRDQVRPTPPLPADCVLAKVLQSCTEIFRYHEHQSLLQNLPDENLNEDEMKLAWDEFNKENENEIQMKKKSIPNATVASDNPSSSSVVLLDTSRTFSIVPRVDTPVVMSSIGECKVNKDKVMDLKVNSTKQKLIKFNLPAKRVYTNRNVRLVNTVKRKNMPSTIQEVVNKNYTAINDNIPVINLDAFADNIDNNMLNQNVEASTSKPNEFVKELFTIGDTTTESPVIDLDDTAGQPNNQQSLIWELNKNLDITVSALEKGPLQVVQKQQTGEIIEID
ncbi:hypothetical protein FQR65_LT00664 [Abscondita terminalis]|nr:hypothetical protein FQR65_LT00664 [Abscondita terminalis]